MTELKSSAKRDWKIISGLVIVTLFIAYLLLRIFVFVKDGPSNSYENTVAGYYQALSKNDTNKIQSLTASDFVDEITPIHLIPGRYEVFPYQTERLDSDKYPISITNNGSEKFVRILYSISTLEDNTRVSYLLEAYFIQENNQPKLQYIKKIQKGKNIAK